jgi:hypothetical protein
MNNIQTSERVDKEAFAVLEPEIQHTLPTTVPPHYPIWPTSLPGPFRKQPPAHMRSINAIRSEQLAEIGYDQETGEPEEADPHRYQPEYALKDRTAFDQPVADV